MKQNALIYGSLGLLIGLIIGFWIANAYNRNFSVPPVVQNSSQLSRTPKSESFDEKLSREEIAASFAAAESRKDDREFQKKLGLALARYAAIQNDSSFLTELILLLERTNRLFNEKDVETLSVMADVYFIKAGEKNDTTLLDKSRKLYRQAISLNPENSDLKAAHASTFLFSKPSQPEAAISELNSILEQNPKHENSLQLLISALIQTKKIELAEQKLAELKKINSSHPAIPALDAQLNQNK